MLLLQGASGQTLAHEQRLQSHSSGWRTVSTELDVLLGATLVEVNLAIEGSGVVRFDKVRLEVLGPASRKP
jgi:hypothetical protein